MSRQKAKESILKAHELKNANTGVYRQFNDKLREEINAIKGDRDLSEEGRANRIAKVRETRGKELLQMAYRRHREFKALLADARKNAEAVIYSDIPKPDQTKIERFDESFRKLRTELMLARDGKAAAQKLTQFIEGVDERYFHHKISEAYADLSTSVLTLDNSSGMRLALSQQYDNLNASYESPDAEAARNSLDTANDMEQSQFFLKVVEDSVREGLGVRYSSFINNTESYYSYHEDERPADDAPATNN
ncbi:hypothetical protein JNUCC31_09025 [Paenibacillus sp. JNUCC31]|uniref:hypothetical protein n=1 Tax=Paenibacillus sp. JNUCC-31 TaxID=2777983 RepID=UPI0017851120|nr:hypothetical protein [Paenibacillus sp. JNUCC-31]QOS80991.1 hypothetical protein JNUCC31_09025 [Paenibacillus sp. JNUCC-31]